MKYLRRLGMEGAIFACLFFLFSGIALAAPIYHLDRTIIPETDSLYDLGTSTAAWRDGYFDRLCFTADTCKTAWPGGGEGSGTVGTSTHEIANNLAVWNSNSATPALLGQVTAGTNGNILGLLNGIPTWVSTSTIPDNNWKVLNGFLSPTTTIPIAITATATSTFAGPVTVAGFSAPLGPSNADYIVSTSAGIASALRTSNGTIVSSNASADVVLRAIVTDAPNGANIYVNPGTYYLNATTTFSGEVGGVGGEYDPTYSIQGAGMENTKFVVENNSDGFYLIRAIHVVFQDFSCYVIGGSNCINSKSGKNSGGVGNRSFWQSRFQGLFFSSTSTTATGWGIIRSNDLRNYYANLQFVAMPNCIKSIAEGTNFNSGDSFFADVQCNLKTNTVGQYAYYFEGQGDSDVNQDVFEDVNASNDYGLKTAWYLSNTDRQKANGLNIEGFATSTELVNNSDRNSFTYSFVVPTTTPSTFFSTDSTSRLNSFNCNSVDSDTADSYILLSDKNTSTGLANVLQGVNGTNCIMTGPGTFTYSTTSASVIRDLRQNTTGSDYLNNVKILGDKLTFNFGATADNYIASFNSVMEFFTNNVFRVAVTYAGRMGIGTTTPSSPLDVYFSDPNTSLSVTPDSAIRVTNPDQTNNNMSALLFGEVNSAGANVSNARILGINTSHTSGSEGGDLAFLTRSSGTILERMRILANGNIGIASSSPGTLLSIGNTGTGPINLSATATSTFGFGINILGGCYGLNGTCLTQNAGTVTSVAASVPSFLTISGSPITTSGTLAISYNTGTPLPIANGGTATTTGGVTNGIEYYNGTNLTNNINLTFDGHQVLQNNVVSLSDLSISTTTTSGTQLDLDTFDGNTGSLAGMRFGVSTSVTGASRKGGIFFRRTGSQGTGALIFSVNTNTGASTNVAAVADQRMIIDQNGNVGINATSTSGGVLGIAGTAGGTTPLLMLSTSTAAFATSTAFTLDKNGLVGIATSSPGTLLSLGNNATQFVNISNLSTSTFGAGGLNILSGCYAINGVCLATSGTNYWTNTGLTLFNNTGSSVGINNTNPSAVLELQATSSAPDFIAWDSTATKNLFNIQSTGNVGIGTTTPFSPLSVSTLAQQSGFTPLLAIASTTNSTLFAFLGNGQFFLGTSTQLVGDNGMIRQIASATNANTAAANSNAAAIVQYNTNATDGTVMANDFRMINTSGAGVLSGRLGVANMIHTAGAETGDMYFTTNNAGTIAEKMRILGSGNVGINDSTPDFKFESLGSNTNGYFGLTNANDGDILTVNTSGFFGIGTTSPWGKVSIGTHNFSTALPSFVIASSSTGVATSTQFIVTNGNVGIASSSPWRTLAVTGTVGFDGLTGSAGLQVGILCLSANKEVINESVACVASSKRFKQDIQSLSSSDALSEVLKLNPVSFRYTDKFNGALKDDPNYNGQQIGFIAEDVQKVDSRFIVLDESKGVAPGTPYTVRYEQMTALLAGAIQAQEKEIEALKVPVGNAARSAEENWQWVCIGLLSAMVLRQQWQVRKLSRKLSDINN